MNTSTHTLVPLLVHLSGARRGRADRLAGEVIPLCVHPGRTAAPDLTPSAVGVATLHRRGGSYEIVSGEGTPIWVNGEQVTRLVLASGDVIELGAGGPVVRFRLQEAGTEGSKSIQDVFSDCWACARYDGGGIWQQAKLLLGGVPMELATRTTMVFRVSVAALIVILGISTVVIGRKNAQLARTMDRDRVELADLASLLQRSRDNPATSDGLLAVLQEVRDSLALASERLGALETRSGAPARIIESASRSTAFLIGAYGFQDPKTGRTLRFALDGAGKPQKSPSGETAITLDGNGPPLEAFYTGTGFIVGPDLVVTNRHVALPWDFEPAAQEMMKQGWIPVMRRFLTYLPGIPEAFETRFVGAGADADVAILRLPKLNGRVPPLPLSTPAPRAGDEVLVLGYPLGIRALMARADARMVASLLGEGDLDPWKAASRLAAEGYITPLASRGIVGQATSEAIVYDAETTHGGSGGPVLTMTGEVMAINAAILPEYGGSNLGVPVARARALLEAVSTQKK